MPWYDLAQNPLAVSSLYTSVPSLASVHIQKIIFLAERLALKIVVELPFPDLAPKRWHYQGYNTVCVELGLGKLFSFQIVEHDPLDLVSVRLEKLSNGSLFLEIYNQSTSIMQGHAESLYLTVVKSKK